VVASGDESIPTPDAPVAPVLRQAELDAAELRGKLGTAALEPQTAS
jgi:hypothetical protein